MILSVLLFCVVILQFPATTTTQLWMAVEAFSSSTSRSAPIIPAVVSSSSSSSSSSIVLFSSVSSSAAELSAREAMERTKNHVQQMTSPTTGTTSMSDTHPMIERKYREYLAYPANVLKKELQTIGLITKGRKPDLARRLAVHEYNQDHPDNTITIDTPATVSATTSVQRNMDDIKNKEKDDGNDNNDDTTTSSSSNDAPFSTGTTSATPTGTINDNTFCGIRLSGTARTALQKAQFLHTPTPIQKNGLPYLNKGESCILHAETGSGKTLAYLLPITEALWHDENNGDDDEEESESNLRYGFIVTPTRELAAQVASVATVLAPPGSIRLLSHPTNLVSEGRYWKERRGTSTHDTNLLQEEMENEDGSLRRLASPRIYIGSAKCIVASLYGDGKMPASPTRKPVAKQILSSTRWIVLDEVDRLLNIKKKGGDGAKTKLGTSKHHEKPAAILTSAVARRTLGQVQIIAASATVGRNLKRELARVLGLPPKSNYPRVISSSSSSDTTSTSTNTNTNNPNHMIRAVTIPDTVTNYIVPVDTTSSGQLLTHAYFVIKNLYKNTTNANQKTLLVLTKSCGISTTHAIGALKHFQCQPEPVSLLDALRGNDNTNNYNDNGNFNDNGGSGSGTNDQQTATGSSSSTNNTEGEKIMGLDQLIDVHRRVTGINSDGIGEDNDDDSNINNNKIKNTTTNSTSSSSSCLLVTGEDTVRGMHIAGLDTVIVVGKPVGPDEYIHIAGRTGRANRTGKVITVASNSNVGGNNNNNDSSSNGSGGGQAQQLQSWSTILNVPFTVLHNINDVSKL